MDSGIGGLNVLAALMKHRCADKYLYLADNRNMPFGDKSREALGEIATAGVKRLLSEGATAIVFGCNTLSASSLDLVRKRFSAPLFGLLPRPELCQGRSLLLTTPATACFLPRLSPNVTLLTPAKLASIIEGEYPDRERTRECLSPLLVPYADVDSVYLGCSHYLYAAPLVREFLPRARVLDGTEPLAALVAAVLPVGGGKSPSVEFHFTGREEGERYVSLLSESLG